MGRVTTFRQSLIGGVSQIGNRVEQCAIKIKDGKFFVCRHYRKLLFYFADNLQSLFRKGYGEWLLLVPLFHPLKPLVSTMYGALFLLV